mmetsp:Transcript_22494/g.53308  ORF Transcript_22494/g.53308 Transcript_22494/m.53308 type:complete len:269 (-) Transcript_22494:704-1510(-)
MSGHKPRRRPAGDRVGARALGRGDEPQLQRDAPPRGERGARDREHEQHTIPAVVARHGRERAGGGAPRREALQAEQPQRARGRNAEWERRGNAGRAGGGDEQRAAAGDGGRVAGRDPPRHHPARRGRDRWPSHRRKQALRSALRRAAAPQQRALPAPVFDLPRGRRLALGADARPEPPARARQGGALGRREAAVAGTGGAVTAAPHAGAHAGGAAAPGGGTADGAGEGRERQAAAAHPAPELSPRPGGAACEAARRHPGGAGEPPKTG